MYPQDIVDAWWKRWAQIIFWMPEDLDELHSVELEMKVNLEHPFHVSPSLRTLLKMQLKNNLKPFWPSSYKQFEMDDKVEKFKMQILTITPQIWRKFDVEGGPAYVEILHRCDDAIYKKRHDIMIDRSEHKHGSQTISQQDRAEYSEKLEKVLRD